MTKTYLIALACSALTLGAFAQNDAPAFKVTTTSAYIWGDTSAHGATSSLIEDPRTGDSVHRLSHAGIEVSSRIGYERISSHQEGKLLYYTTSIANTTNSDISVEYGGTSIDGRIALPISLALTAEGLKRRERKDVLLLSNLHCFKSGFASTENFFSASTLSKVFTVRPQTSITVSSVSKDPRSSPLLCSMDGCHVTGTIRYYITVNRKDYVFVWPGRDAVYCGE